MKIDCLSEGTLLDTRIDESTDDDGDEPQNSDEYCFLENELAPQVIYLKFNFLEFNICYKGKVAKVNIIIISSNSIPTNQLVIEIKLFKE